MLELRPNCECCDKDLPPDASDARICTFECTFCADCVDNVLGGVCPNCGGNFAPADPAGIEAGKISAVGQTCAQGRRLRPTQGRLTISRMNVAQKCAAVLGKRHA